MRMYDFVFIRKLLKTYITKGVNQFVIYPFGENGIVVRNVLKDCFGLEPCFIVDNEYSKYNCNIVNIDRLKNFYRKDMYIILTAEDVNLNAQMYNELSEFASKSNIINIRKQGKLIESSNSRYCPERLFVNNFLPDVKTITPIRRKSEKIKVRIVHGSPLSWNAVSTVCKAIKDDELFDILILLGEFMCEKSIKQVIEGGYRYVMQDKYQGNIDKPDILIFSSPFDKLSSGLLECRKYIKLVVVVSWMLIRYSFDNSIEKLWWYFQKDFGVYRPDYYLYDSLLYNEFKQSDFFLKKW